MCCLKATKAANMHPYYHIAGRSGRPRHVPLCVPEISFRMSYMQRTPTELGGCGRTILTYTLDTLVQRH